MKRKNLFHMLLLLLVFPWIVGSPTLQAATQEDMEVLRIVNSERSSRGILSLIMDSKINQAADVRAEEVAQYFSHDRPDGSDCFTVFREIGMTYRTCGENIAMVHELSAERVMENWMDSQGHRENILHDRFTHIGIGHYTAPNGQTYWVQLFAAPTGGTGAEVRSADAVSSEAPASYPVVSAHPGSVSYGHGRETCDEDDDYDDDFYEDDDRYHHSYGF